MEYVPVLTQWALANMAWILMGVSITLVLALIIFIRINTKLSRMLKKYDILMRGMEGKNLEEVLFAHVRRVDDALVKVDELFDQSRRLEGIQEHCLQKVGIVRYSAFQDTGSDLSFSIAILDARHNGLIISSLFGRDESRTYGKPVNSGKSTYLLTDEEQKALEIAMNNK